MNQQQAPTAAPMGPPQGVGVGPAGLHHPPQQQQGHPPPQQHYPPPPPHMNAYGNLPPGQPPHVPPPGHHYPPQTQQMPPGQASQGHGTPPMQQPVPPSQGPPPMGPPSGPGMMPGAPHSQGPLGPSMSSSGGTVDPNQPRQVNKFLYYYALLCTNKIAFYGYDSTATVGISAWIRRNAGRETSDILLSTDSTTQGANYGV